MAEKSPKISERQKEGGDKEYTRQKAVIDRAKNLMISSNHIVRTYGRIFQTLKQTYYCKRFIKVVKSFIFGQY